MQHKWGSVIHGGDANFPCEMDHSENDQNRLRGRSMVGVRSSCRLQMGRCNLSTDSSPFGLETAERPLNS